MLVLICLLLSTCQCNGCLDLLVRSFNEIFSPIIETGDSRREQAHDVDDLTHFYKRDRNGNFILDESKWYTVNQYRRKQDKPPEIVGSLFSQLRSATNNPSKLDDSLSCSNTENNNTTHNSSESSVEPNGNEIVDPQTPDDGDENGSSLPQDDVDDTSTEEGEFADIDDNSFEFNFGDGKRYGPKRDKYVPGRRPLVDFFIKLLELFQLTADSKFIASRPRYRTARFSPNTNDNYKR